ncbi:MAG: prolyl oligopeptidase family serine peptidase [Candidatus Nanopelagicales bacterium]
MDSYPRQAAVTGQFRHGQPRNFRVTAAAVYYLRSAGSRLAELQLHRWDRASGQTETILAGAPSATMSAAERTMRERVRESASGITAYDVRGDRVIASAGGGLLGWDTDDGAREIPGVAAGFDPRLSPDGRWISWIANGGLHLCAWDGSQPRVIVAADGDESWAVADFIAAEEFSRSRGYWWLPDSSGLLVQRTDDRSVPVWWRSDPANPQNAPAKQRYPHAGATNASVCLWRFDLDGEGARLELPDSEYLATVAPNVITVFDREQKALTVCDFTGEPTTILRHDPWLDLVPGLPRRTESGRLLAWVDADRRRLTIDGSAVTPEDVQLRSVVGVTGETIFLTASTSPAESRLARVDDTGFTWLSDPGLVTTATVGHGLIVTSEVGWHDYRAVVTIRDTNYEPIAAVENLAEEPVTDARPHLLASEVDAVQTVVLWPTGPASGPLPVLMLPYGGPHAQRVLAARSAYAGAQWMADQGFCVVIADGRGTPGQSPAWEQAVAGNLRDPALEDQVLALQSVAAAHPERVDVSRVGIVGWSYGGYLAALAVLQRPDVFHAAIAGAPVTDWRLYDTAYTERYLGNPSTDPAPYDHCSLLTMAEDLQRPLLLIHGMADDNVFAAHSLRLSTQLLRAGRAHEVLPLSGVTHMTPQPEVAENLLLLQIDFFRRHLGC